MDFTQFQHSYEINSDFEQRAAYFCMEFGIDQAFKIFSGGLGYLAGSHMRSAYALRQNMVGIGILWKYGYYDQTLKGNREMNATFVERHYNFLEDTGLLFEIKVHGHPVKVRAYYLAPEIFGTAPMFFLSTAIPENDFLAQTISHRLYDNNVETKIAQCILLGKGGAKLLELINWKPATYHLNEAHALPAAFHLYEQLGDIDAVRLRTVFTTHTPVEAGNEKHDIHLLHRMNFFGDLLLEHVRELTGIKDNTFSHSLVALRLAKIANGVSKIHGEVARQMWNKYDNIPEITHITNSQNHAYWHDAKLDSALAEKDDQSLWKRKLELKSDLFKTVADVTGKLFDPNVLTLVWARRFAGYKRADLITRDMERFEALINDKERPIQIIWSGKPYPMDYGAIDTWNYLSHLSKKYPNVAVLPAYELDLSKQLKQGSDVWLNNPRIPREASGTSGMTAAMNGSISLSTHDGWVAEFTKHGENGYLIPKVDLALPQNAQDVFDRDNLLEVIEKEILPTYYDTPEKWLTIVKNAMEEICPFFDSDRMAAAYYTQLYTAKVAVNS